MMKQATMEMWFGFRQRMKTLGGWLFLALIIFVIFTCYGSIMNDHMVPVFLIPYMMGSGLGWMSGSNTGKLIMVLPMSSKEYKWLVYMKTAWVLFVDIAGIVIYTVIYIGINRTMRENCFELFFMLILPSLFGSALIFIISSLPIKLAVYEKGYKFPMWPTVLGEAIIFTYSLWGAFSNTLEKVVWCLLIYIFILYAIWKVDRRLFDQTIYYDEVEKEAGKVHW